MAATLLMMASVTARESSTPPVPATNSVTLRVSAVPRTTAPRSATAARALLTRTSVFASVTISFQPPKFAMPSARAPPCKHLSLQRARCVFTTPSPRPRPSPLFQTRSAQLSAPKKMRPSASWLVLAFLTMAPSKAITICLQVSLQVTPLSKRSTTVMLLLVALTYTKRKRRIRP